MPRKSRLFLPETPQHIVVRGHNRSPILARVEDFRCMYQSVREASEKYGLNVHAWVFMHNHLHILATPENEDSAPRVMQSIGRRYSQFFNKHYGRTGALWEGRYKSALVDTDKYLLCCYRYIELNPVRAGIVRKPENYPYSSYHANALGKPDKMVTPHSVFLALGGADISHAGSDSAPLDPSGPGSDSAQPSLTPEKPLVNHPYLALFDQALSRKELTDIRRATNKNSAIGSNQFILRVAALLS